MAEQLRVGSQSHFYTGLHLTLLKGRWVQAWGAHLPGAKRVGVYRWHPQTRTNTRADACAQRT